MATSPEQRRHNRRIERLWRRGKITWEAFDWQDISWEDITWEDITWETSAAPLGGSGGWTLVN